MCPSQILVHPRTLTKGRILKKTRHPLLLSSPQLELFCRDSGNALCLLLPSPQHWTRTTSFKEIDANRIARSLMRGHRESGQQTNPSHWILLVIQVIYHPERVNAVQIHGNPHGLCNPPGMHPQCATVFLLVAYLQGYLQLRRTEALCVSCNPQALVFRFRFPVAPMGKVFHVGGSATSCPCEISSDTDIKNAATEENF